MKVISDSLLSCFERISSERYGLLCDLAGKGLFPLTELERIVEEFTIQRYNLAKNFHESAKAISINADVDARNVISRNYYAMFHSARAVIFHFYRYDEEKHEEYDTTDLIDERGQSAMSVNQRLLSASVHLVRGIL
jgi:hypothetical protein